WLREPRECLARSQETGRAVRQWPLTSRRSPRRNASQARAGVLHTKPRLLHIRLEQFAVDAPRRSLRQPLQRVRQHIFPFHVVIWTRLRFGDAPAQLRTLLVTQE